jgi:hypothetical protein
LTSVPVVSIASNLNVGIARSADNSQFVPFRLAVGLARRVGCSAPSKPGG